MDEKIAIAEKKVLVQMVRLAQKRGMKGSKGDWKEYLNSYDKKFGASLSDPAKRPNDVLVAFINTFTKDDDIKFFDKVMQCHEKQTFVEQLTKIPPANESPEQRLVRLTLEHPQYPFDYSFPSIDEGWVVSKFSKKSKSRKSNLMVAVDCEMVLCEDGTEALVRVCVVDRDLHVIIDEFVNPNKPVADYRTDITGVAPGDLDGVSCSLADVQKSMTKLLSSGTILIGHSLNNDLHALKIDHARVIDTSLIFKYSGGPMYRRPSLNNLCKSILGYEVRKKGAPHNCLDDAQAAMKLVLAKIDGKVGDAIPLVQEDVLDVDTTKLFLHRIPIHVTSEELTRIIPGDFTIELKSSKKGQGKIYSAFALFKNSLEAHQAFENLEGRPEKDSYGRPQKLITFKLSTGVAASTYVREMAINDSPCEFSSKKRNIEEVENSGAAKKLKTDQTIEDDTMADSDKCCNHLKEIEGLKQEPEHKEPKHCCDHLREIESLKQELKAKEYELTVLHKALTNVKKEKNNRKKGKKH